MEVGIFIGLGLGIFGVIFVSRGYKKLKNSMKPVKKPVKLVMCEQLPDGSFKEHKSTQKGKKK